MSVLILREKRISAMMSERRKMDTSVEERIGQLEENVTRLQLQRTDCSDAAVQTISTLDYSDAAVQTISALDYSDAAVQTISTLECSDAAVQTISTLGDEVRREGHTS